MELDTTGIWAWINSSLVEKALYGYPEFFGGGVYLKQFCYS